MAVNKISMGINYRKKTNSRMTGSGNYFAEVDRRETLTTRGLAEHLKDHGCLAGLDAIQAVLVKISQCVPELVAQGIGVKLDGLGIFYPTIKNKKGGATEAQMLDKDYNPTSLIEGVHVRFSPESTDLDNLTSKQFLTRSVTTASQNIVKAVERTVNGKTRKIRTVVSIDDFRNPNGSSNAPANSGSNTGGGTGGNNTGGSTGGSTGGDDGAGEQN
jgi:hypothetical protein